VGAWNVLFWREDDTLSLLSSELKRLNIGIAELTEVRRPDSDEISLGWMVASSRMRGSLRSFRTG